MEFSLLFLFTACTYGTGIGIIVFMTRLLREVSVRKAFLPLSKSGFLELQSVILFLNSDKFQNLLEKLSIRKLELRLIFI